MVSPGSFLHSLLLAPSKVTVSKGERQPMIACAAWFILEAWFWVDHVDTLVPPACSALSPFSWGRVPLLNRLQEKDGTLILTSLLLEDLGPVETVSLKPVVSILHYSFNNCLLLTPDL